MFYTFPSLVRVLDVFVVVVVVVDVLVFVSVSIVLVQSDIYVDIRLEL